MNSRRYFSNKRNQGSLEREMIPGLGQERPEVSLEYYFRNKEEVFQIKWGHVKRTQELAQ